MKQTSLALGQSNKPTRRRVFLLEMERVVPWSELVALIAPHCPEGRRGRPPFNVEAMLRIHFMQQWFNLSDPAMEEALHDVPLFRDFAGLGGWADRLPDESTILRFRHLLEAKKLGPQILAAVNELLERKGKVCINPGQLRYRRGCSPGKMLRMKQASLGLGQSSKPTRRRVFLSDMERVVPWSELVALIQPYLPEGRRGRPPFNVEAMLRIHFMQQWFNLSDPAMEEALHDMALFRDFAGLGGWGDRLPDESTILRFRHLLEEKKLAPKMLATVNELLERKGLLLRAGTVVDATLIAAPSSTKNRSGERDPEMHQSKKGQQWYFGMKAHIGVDAESGLVHTVRGTAGNVGDVVEANSLLHGQETQALGDAGYQGVDKRPDANPKVLWHVAMRPGKRKLLDKSQLLDRMKDELEHTKASIRAKVEHPFRVLKQQFGHVKVRYRGLAKNTAQLHTLFALSNLWMARGKFTGALA